MFDGRKFMRNKRTKAVDIVGRWIDHGDKIERYKNIPEGVRCSHCVDGLDKECPVCHGSQCESPIKWYQLKKRFDKWLE